MQRTVLVRIVAVVVAAFFVGEGRSVAQERTSKTPAVDSNAARPSSFSLVNASGADLASLRSNSLMQQSGSEGADAVAERQSMDSFTSLEDGQPGDPGALELQLDFGWSTSSDDSDTYTWDTQIKYTGEGSDFLKNMKLALTVPLEVGNAGIDGNGDLEIEWQQRWVAEQGNMPTIATLFTIRAPTGYHSDGIDATFTGVVAKDFGPGTFFLNGWVKSANGSHIEDRRDVQWGGRLAYLWRFDENASLTVNYVYETSEMDGESDMNLLELGAQFQINDNLTLGPGVFVGLDGKDATPDFGAGIRITYGF